MTQQFLGQIVPKFLEEGRSKICAIDLKSIQDPFKSSNFSQKNKAEKQKQKQKQNKNKNKTKKTTLKACSKNLY